MPDQSAAQVRKVAGEDKLRALAEQVFEHGEIDDLDARALLQEIDGLREVANKLLNYPLTWHPRSGAERESFNEISEAIQKARCHLGR